MSSLLKNKKILLGITGSIAAYKAAFLTRLLIKAGAEVKIVMTRSSESFISPLTLSTLSKNPVLSDISDESAWNNHVELGLWADLMIVAPATANTLAKFAIGICDNLLTAVYLSAKCPVAVAPAMDLDMWVHPSTKRNVATLVNDGIQMIDVNDGELASGLIGKGRMAEPEQIVDFAIDLLAIKKKLAGRSILITAGPTQESLDPVRFISNHATGKMGIAIADHCHRLGAQVHLVLGPTRERPEEPVNVYHVRSARDMYEQCRSIFKKADVAILAAAVADYRPADISSKKIKKKEGPLSIELERTNDIAESLGHNKRKNQWTVGFALETNDEIVNAKRKLKKKNFDMIVLNSLQDKGAGFGYDTNKISIIGKGNKIKQFQLKTKKEVAVDIVDELLILIDKK